MDWRSVLTSRDLQLQSAILHEYVVLSIELRVRSAASADGISADQQPGWNAGKS